MTRDGASITTIEGLADGDKLHPLQQAFMDHDAFQCGYCTPGQICSALGMITEARAQDPRRRARDDERQPLSVRCLPEHRRRYNRGDGGRSMNRFDYVRAGSVAEAVTGRSRSACGLSRGRY